MTFDQLARVRRDNIVPERELLQSLWLQTSLTNQPLSTRRLRPPSVRGPDAASALKHKLPIFRFSVVFKNVVKSFQEGAQQGMWNVSSEPVSCAGVQYRVVLSLVEMIEATDGHEGVRGLQGNEETVEEADSCMASPIKMSRRGTPRLEEGAEDHGVGELGSEGSEDAETRAKASTEATRELRVMLQRKSVSASSRRSTKTTDHSAIDYRIYAFDTNSFESKKDWWRCVLTHGFVVQVARSLTLSP